MDIIPYILLCLLLSAFFSGMEIAFMSANRLRIEIDKKQGQFSAVIISYFTRRPSEYIVTMLVANNIVLVIYGLLFSQLLDPFIQGWMHNELYILVIKTIISTLFILITAEFLPKVVFRLMPNFFLNLFSIPVLLSYLILFPITHSVMWISMLFLKKFNKNEKQKEKSTIQVFGKVDLLHLLNNLKNNGSRTLDTEHEIRIFQNALDFSKVKLRECMVPRPELVALPVTAGLESLKNKFIDSGFSKIIIYENSIDNIIGYVSSKELFKNPVNIRSKIIKAPIVPETMNANKLLRIFLQERKSLAVVVDEFGGTSGIVTIEDIMEEIFGEIEDEHDTNESVEKMLSDNTFMLSGKLQIDYLNEKFDLKIPEDDNYDTLAGFVFFSLGRIPILNESFTILDFEIKVLKTKNKMLEIIYIKKITNN